MLQTFCELLARVGTNHDATALDFFECKFNKGLALLRYKRLRKEINRGKVFRDIGTKSTKTASRSIRMKRSRACRARRRPRPIRKTSSILPKCLRR